jgi:hypothetical protein
MMGAQWPIIISSFLITENQEIYDEFCDYFISSGQVSWQWEMI